MSSREPTPTAIRRLQKDYAKLLASPVDGIVAGPKENNILEWNFCLQGSVDTVYEGGYYWGKINFKPDFPFSPPSIKMLTPNGRFEPNVRLCLSISDYHPESWNPGWTVASILVGLHSFMNENSSATGAIIVSNPDVPKRFAILSKEYNMGSQEFCTAFPDLVAKWRKE